MWWRFVLTAAAVLAVAGTLSACAQTMSKAEYSALVQDAEKQRSTALSGLSQANTADASFYRTAAKNLRTTATELADVAPPTEVAAANAAYIESLNGLAEVFESFADCAEIERKASSKTTSGRDCRQEIGQSRLDEVQNDFDEAAAIFRAKGYRLTA